MLGAVGEDLGQTQRTLTVGEELDLVGSHHRGVRVPARPRQPEQVLTDGCDVVRCQHRLAPDADQVTTHRERGQAPVRQTQAPRSDGDDLIRQVRPHERVDDPWEPSQERQRDVIPEDQGRSPKAE